MADRSLVHKKGISGVAESVVRSVRSKKSEADEKPVDFLHSGCTPLNLALSGRADGGWARGRVLNIVGDGSSGKTLLALELASWCYYKIQNVKSKLFPKVKNVKIIYDNVEGVMDFPITKMYGSSFVKGVDWRRSKTAEQFGRSVGREIVNLKDGTFLLYIVDSLDSLVSSASEKRFDDAIKKDKDEDGAYKGAEKAAYFSQSFFGNLCNKIYDYSGKVKRQKDATVFIVSQVRTKMGVVFGRKEYRTGGKGMDFYTHQVLWIRESGPLERQIDKKKRTYGIRCEGRVDRSKVAKPYRVAPFQIIYDYGLDDVRTMIDYLNLDKYYWPIDRPKVNFRNLESMINFIEKNNLEDELKRIVENDWIDTEKKFLKPLEKRKKRFE